ncbi:MAG: hypothetical protein JW841_17630 [Deltaproteobacteria bacterium]|nr:hypothetical protein [Deltaproteobacteria bacterium]
MITIKMMSFLVWVTFILLHHNYASAANSNITATLPNGVNITFSRISTGSFMMGSTDPIESQWDKSNGSDVVNNITLNKNVFDNAAGGSIMVTNCANFTFTNNIVSRSGGTTLTVSSLLKGKGSTWDYNIYLPDFSYPSHDNGQGFQDTHSYFGTNPRLKDIDHPVGGDGIPWIDDDGLRLMGNSPVNAANNTEGINFFWVKKVASGRFN